MTYRPPSRISRELAKLRTMLAITATMLGLALTAAPAMAPESSPHLVAALPPPTLESTGGTLTLTGSVDALFASDSFIGTNKALKQDRVRPRVVVAEFTSTFSGIRAQIASIREQQARAKAAKPNLVAELAPAQATPALNAIDSLAAPGTDAPQPVRMSEKLAYARADQPVTATTPAVPLKTKKGVEVSDKDLWCMATAIYFEARGESYQGQIAVGQVVMNRLAHPLYPKSICGVVFQNEHMRNACQFSFACDGISEKVTDQKSWAQAMKIAKNVIAGKDRVDAVGHATHYHATYVRPDWAPRMKKVAKIGQHVFYQFKRGWRFG